MVCRVVFHSFLYSSLQISNKISNRNWGWLTLLSILISMASVVFMAWLSTVFVNKNIPVFWFVADSNHIMALVTALCSFMFSRT